MDNQTTIKYFYFLVFSIKSEKQPLFSTAFFLMYLIGVLGNAIIIIVVYIDSHLHTPMYLFLVNLSFVDIGLTTVILPKLTYILLSANNAISSSQCFTQMFFCIFLLGTEMILLSTMAYDRYVAICQPLHYHIIINKKICALLLGGTWISGCVNSILFTVFASNVSLCHDNPIDNYYCDSKALVKMICADPIYLIIPHVESVVFGLFPFLLSLISYIKIISSILSLRSKESRRKAFSTCTSHLTVLVIFYGSIICVYMKSSSEHTSVLDQVFSVLYTAVTPMLNPLIYSLKNKEVKNAFKRILTQTQTGQTLFFSK